MTDTARGWTDDEMMSIVGARALRDGQVCFVGIGLPSVVANLARRTHAPNLMLIYESGPLGSRPEHLPLSIGDGELASSATAVVSMPEIFNYWLQGGHIDVGYLSGAQVDRYGNLNSTVIGDDYYDPTVRLPGAGGAPEIAASCRELTIIMRHERRRLVERVDFVTSVGFGRDGTARPSSALPGNGPTSLITDLGVLTPDPVDHEFVLTSLHPGVDVDTVRANTGWNLRVAADLAMTDPPSTTEMDALRSLQRA